MTKEKNSGLLPKISLATLLVGYAAGCGGDGKQFPAQDRPDAGPAPADQEQPYEAGRIDFNLIQSWKDINFAQVYVDNNRDSPVDQVHAYVNLGDKGMRLSDIIAQSNSGAHADAGLYSMPANEFFANYDAETTTPVTVDGEDTNFRDVFQDYVVGLMLNYFNEPNTEENRFEARKDSNALVRALGDDSERAQPGVELAGMGTDDATVHFGRFDLDGELTPYAILDIVDESNNRRLLFSYGPGVEKLYKVAKEMMDFGF
ncbi:hypothetical protein KY339_02280 [Candidatus Woesearchaeota archaeon]|nr:hypothetical protein [Candidatus Woesearchaeota archaeon]